MSILTTLKNTFAPTEEVSAARRQAAFGSTSKVGAATKIVALGVAAETIAVPALRAVTVPIIKKAATSFAGATTKTQVTVALGSAAVYGVARESPQAVITAIPKVLDKTADLSGDVYNWTQNPTSKGLENLYEDNKTAVTVATGFGLYLGGKALLPSALNYLNTRATNKNTKALLDAIPSLGALPVGVTNPPPSVPPLLPPPDKPPKDKDKVTTSIVPLTPETQIIGKPAGNKNITKRKKRRVLSRPTSNSNRISLNIFNQSKHLYTGRYTY